MSRFEVRLVDEINRRYRYVTDFWTYHDACIAADVGHGETGAHFIVWDSRLKQPLYDSRRLRAPAPTPMENWTCDPLAGGPAIPSDEPRRTAPADLGHM